MKDKHPSNKSLAIAALALSLLLPVVSAAQGQRGAGARHLVNRYRIGESLDRHRAEGLHGDVAFRQLHSVGRCKYRTGLRHLFHASRQVRCLAYDGVIYVQVVADGTDNDLP